MDLLADDQLGNSHIEMLISLLYFPSLTKKYCMYYVGK